jgi:hypothetical protein
MENSDNHSRASTSSTLDGRPDGIKEKPRDEGEFSHRDDGAVLPSEIGNRDERQGAVRRMSRNAVNAMLENPLAVKSREAVINGVKKFVRDSGFPEDEEFFIKGALVARDPDDFENIQELSDEDKAALRKEVTHRWHQPFMMYFLVGISLLLSRLIPSFVQYGCGRPRDG